MDDQAYFLRAITTLAKDMGYSIIDNQDHLRVEFSCTTDLEYQGIINHLNELVEAKFRWETEATKKLIDRLLRHSYTIEDIIKVISYKTREWKHDSNMSQYLRPQTLFNYNKFEGYLFAANQAPKVTLHDLLKDDWSSDV